MADSPNMQKIKSANNLTSLMYELIRTYEAGVLDGPGGLEYPLTAQHITDLKQQFVSLRTQCIAALNGIVG